MVMSEAKEKNFLEALLNKISSGFGDEVITLEGELVSIEVSKQGELTDIRLFEAQANPESVLDEMKSLMTSHLATIHARSSKAQNFFLEQSSRLPFLGQHLTLEAMRQDPKMARLEKLVGSPLTIYDSRRLLRIKTDCRYSFFQLESIQPVDEAYDWVVAFWQAWHAMMALTQVSVAKLVRQAMDPAVTVEAMNMETIIAFPNQQASQSTQSAAVEMVDIQALLKKVQSRNTEIKNDLAVKNKFKTRGWG